MAVTQAEVLDLFTQVSAIKNSDQILMEKANGDGTVTAAKITAELLRAYLNDGYALTIDSEGYICIGGVRTDMLSNAVRKVYQTATSVAIDPNVLNVWGEMSLLTVAFNPGSVGQVNEYMIEFRCPSSRATILSLPSSVRWSDDPLIPQPNHYYQISVVDDLAVYMGWPITSSSSD